MPIQYPIILPPQGVRSITLRPKNSVMVSTSPFTGQQQVQANQGQWWEADVEFAAMKQSGYADDIAAAITSLRGQYGTFLLGDSSRKTPRGTASGLKRVYGGSQTGMQLITSGWSANEIGVLKKGDYIQLGGANLLKRSEDFSYAEWTKSNVTVTPDSVVAPDGTTTADTLASTGSDGFITQSFNPLNQQSYTCSIWLRCASGTVSVDLLTYSNAPPALLNQITITVTTSWQRFTIGAIALSGFAHVFQLGGSSSFSTGKSVYAWGAQINHGGDADGYIATTSAAVSRTARLHKIMADAYSDGSGLSTLEIWPRLRESPDNFSGIKLSNCRGTFRLASNDAGWSVDPAKIYSAGISAVEAI